MSFLLAARHQARAAPLVQAPGSINQAPAWGLDGVFAKHDSRPLLFVATQRWIVNWVGDCVCGA